MFVTYIFDLSTMQKNLEHKNKQTLILQFYGDRKTTFQKILRRAKTTYDISFRSKYDISFRSKYYAIKDTFLRRWKKTQ